MSDHQPILSPAEFTQSAAQLLAAQPEIEVLDVDNLTVEVRVQGRTVVYDLASFYGLYRDAPDQLVAVQAALQASLVDMPPDRSEDDPATLLDRVMPMLKPISLLSHVREQQLPMLAYRPLAGDLIVTYVIDEGQRVVYINEDHLARWKVGEPALNHAALRNLRVKPWQPEPGVIGGSRGGLLIFNSGDGYDATRLLLPELFAEFAAQTRGRLVMGVPNRDFLIAFGDADAQVVQQIHTQIETDMRTHDHPVSDQLFTYERGQLAVYTADV